MLIKVCDVTQTCVYARQGCTSNMVYEQHGVQATWCLMIGLSLQETDMQMRYVGTVQQESADGQHCRHHCMHMHTGASTICKSNSKTAASQLDVLSIPHAAVWQSAVLLQVCMPQLLVLSPMRQMPPLMHPKTS